MAECKNCRWTSGHAPGCPSGLFSTVFWACFWAIQLSGAIGFIILQLVTQEGM